MKRNPEGEEPENVGFEENHKNIILTAYPNPFNPSTIIRYTINVLGNVTIRLYNITGQQVAELVTGQKE